MHFNKDLNIAASGEDTEDASVASSVNKLLRGSLRALKLDTTRGAPDDALIIINYILNL